MLRNHILTVTAAVLVAIPGWIAWEKSQQDRSVLEAVEALRRVYERSVIVVHKRKYVNLTQRLPAQFPPSTPWTPSQRCWEEECSVARWKIESSRIRGWLLNGDGSKAVEVRPWRQLRLRFADPLHFQYRYTSRGTGPGASFTIEARGGRPSDPVILRRGGTLRKDGGVEPTPLTISPLEGH